MNKTASFILALALAFASVGCSKSKPAAGYESTKAERNSIKAGNKEFADSNFLEALQKYNEALAAAPGSEPAIFNRADAIYNFAQTQPEGKRDTLIAQAVEIYESLGNYAHDTSLREKANYNLGNIFFNQEDYKKSIDYYKKVLRANPSNQITRENLRVAQLKMPPEDENQDQQDQDDQQDQQQDQQQQQQQQQEQEQEQQQMSSNAEQILQTMQNRENQTREDSKKEQRQTATRSTDKPW